VPSLVKGIIMNLMSTTGIVHRNGHEVEMTTYGYIYARTGEGCNRWLLFYRETRRKVTCKHCIRTQYPAERGR
jgi:hypothetical protein